MPNIILLGSPGSGKGTQAERLKQKYNLHHLSTGELFRDHIKKQTEVGKQIQQLVSRGLLVPDDMTNVVVKNYIEHFTNVLFDGYPRTLAQAKRLHDMLARFDEDIDVVVSIDVPDKEVVRRIIKRGMTSGRTDDNEQTAKDRLREYYDKTQPLLDHYDKQHKVLRVNGYQSIDGVTEEIIEKLAQFLP